MDRHDEVDHIGDDAGSYLTNASKFGSVKDKERAYMAYLGINESMAERIDKQFKQFGETVDGVKVANTDKWSDPVARRPIARR